jgi:hypothetical protein
MLPQMTALPPVVLSHNFRSRLDSISRCSCTIGQELHVKIARHAVPPSSAAATNALRSAACAEGVSEEHCVLNSEP